MFQEGSNVDVARESPEGKAFGQQQGEVEAVGRSDVTLALRSHLHHIGPQHSFQFLFPFSQGSFQCYFLKLNLTFEMAELACYVFHQNLVHLPKVSQISPSCLLYHIHPLPDLQSDLSHWKNKTKPPFDHLLLNSQPPFHLCAIDQDAPPLDQKHEIC